MREYVSVQVTPRCINDKNVLHVLFSVPFRLFLTAFLSGSRVVNGAFGFLPQILLVLDLFILVLVLVFVSISSISVQQQSTKTVSGNNNNNNKKKKQQRQSTMALYHSFIEKTKT